MPVRRRTWRFAVMGQITTNARPISHTIARVCALTGYGPTTVWKLIASHRLEVIRLKGVRRTLVTDASLMRLLAPASAPRRRGRPPKGQWAHDRQGDRIAPGKEVNNSTEGVT